MSRGLRITLMAMLSLLAIAIIGVLVADRIILSNRHRLLESSATQEASTNVALRTTLTELSAIQEAQETSQASLEAALGSTESELTLAQTQLADSDEELNRINDRLQDMINDLASKRFRVTELESILVCSNRPESIDYSSNSSVSASLKQWLEQMVGSIDKARWDKVWWNSKVTIHKLSGENLWVYVVYFDEKQWDLKNSVIDINNSCYLDY